VHGTLGIAGRLQVAGWLTARTGRDAVIEKKTTHSVVGAAVYTTSGGLLISAVVILTLWLTGNYGSEPAQAETVRDYTLEIVPKDIDYGGGAVWHAWTYNGTVPGTTIRVKVGELLRVKLVNKHNLVHSFHTHLTNYEFKYDGSQANVIGNDGAGAMVPPGGEYTYEFRPTAPGIYYYHCHSADSHHISGHIHQGLYGAIIVEDPDAPPMREEVLFMAESGHEREGNAPAYIMNGLGLPGGEPVLEQIYKEQGFAAVAAQLNKTVPAFNMTVNSPIKLHVINIGDQIHSFHMHSATHVSLATLDGKPWPANVVPLVPGQADTLLVNFTNPGLWLFHCHVVIHADQGMIGLFNVTAALQ